MREYGSDFHQIEGNLFVDSKSQWLSENSMLFADGRLCFLVLILQYGWKRLWVPEYFCYNIVDYLQRNTQIEVVFYDDYPGNDDERRLSSMAFKNGDALLRMNYFGLRTFRSEKQIPIPVIEDHSHDLIGDWAKNSDADWCIASLRKIIPIPEGGILWSPKGLSLDIHPVQTSFNEELARKRWSAMEEKSRYLMGEKIDKNSFRKLYMETEDAFDKLGLSSIDEKSRKYLERFDTNSWYAAKKRNWKILSNLSINEGVQVMCPENETLVPLSLIILFDDGKRRDRIKNKLINSSIYPAVLWNVPDGVHEEVKEFSDRMLSIHCDGRYNESEIMELYNMIKTIIQND